MISDSTSYKVLLTDVQIRITVSAWINFVPCAEVHSWKRITIKGSNPTNFLCCCTEQSTTGRVSANFQTGVKTFCNSLNSFHCREGKGVPTSGQVLPPGMWHHVALHTNGWATCNTSGFSWQATEESSGLLASSHCQMSLVLVSFCVSLRPGHCCVSYLVLAVNIRKKNKAIIQ